jgi:hypothetical protein
MIAAAAAAAAGAGANDIPVDDVGIFQSSFDGRDRGFLAGWPSCLL